MKKRTLVGLFGSTLLVVGCSTSISVADYNTSCEVDADCVPVPEGERCDIRRCGCSSGAINRADEDQYREDLAALVCADPFIGFGDRCICAPLVGVCDGGTCSSVEGIE
jgi:hypothetical protein